MQHYSPLQKYFHDLVFNNKIINKSLYEIEKLFLKKDLGLRDEYHVFITSLPRSGTTVLLNYLDSTNLFASLKYLNMPFIMSPNISKFLYRKNIKKKERLHNDGLKYDLESPEAFDEVFFSNNELYLKKEILNFINLILKSQKKKRYLSKNNLNYKRITLIKSILPNSIFVIPVREPLQHSFSLLKQHLHFCDLQEKDDFIRRYMNYLGHNEFGIDHKPWNIPKNYFDKTKLNYWLEQWFLFYSNILKKFKFDENCKFLINEDFSHPSFKEKINKNLKLIEDKNFCFKKITNKTIELEFDKKNYEKSLEIYDSFLDQRKL